MFKLIAEKIVEVLSDNLISMESEALLEAKETIQEKDIEIEQLNARNIKNLEDFLVQKRELIKKNDSEVNELIKDYGSEKRILQNEHHIAINKAIEEAVKIQKNLEIENATLKKEVEILNKAFENMGWDVKDTKSILDKLVDGIVGKNTINVIK